jgi:hypothetical protein
MHLPWMRQSKKLTLKKPGEASKRVLTSLDFAIRKLALSASGTKCLYSIQENIAYGVPLPSRASCWRSQSREGAGAPPRDNLFLEIYSSA